MKKTYESTDCDYNIRIQMYSKINVYYNSFFKYNVNL